MRRNARREQAEHKQTDTSLAALEAELHAKQPRGQRRASERSAQRAEAASIIRPSGQSFTGRPVA